MFDPAISGVIVAGLLVFFLTTVVHIGVALGLSGFLGIFITIGERAAVAQLATVPFQQQTRLLWQLSPSLFLWDRLQPKQGLQKIYIKQHTIGWVR